MSVIDDWATWKTKITSPLTHYLHLKNVCWVGNTPHYDKIHWFQASPSYLCNSSLDLEHVFFCYLPVSTQILPDASIWRQLFYQKLDFAPDVQLGSFGDSCLSLSPLGPREVYRWEDQLQLLLSSILLGDVLTSWPRNALNFGRGSAAVNMAAVNSVPGLWFTILRLRPSQIQSFVDVKMRPRDTDTALFQPALN